MQKLVTEVRRFRSDQASPTGRRCRRLSGVDEAGLGAHVAAVTALAWLTEPRDFAPRPHVEVRLSGGTVDVELDTSAPSTWPPSGAGWRRSSPPRRRNWRDHGQARNAAFLAKAPDAVVARSVTVSSWPARKSSASRPAWLRWREHLEPEPDEIAALLQVEHLLDQRWPETKLEPTHRASRR